MKLGIALIAAGAIALSLAVPVIADDNEVMLGNYLLLRIRTSSSGYSVAERADIIQKRANNILEYGKYTVNDIRVVPKGNDVAVYVGDQLIITADSREARANKTTPAGLANVWAARLRELLPLAKPKPVEQPTEPAEDSSPEAA